MDAQGPGLAGSGERRILESFAVWTGDAALEPGSCRHLSGQATVIGRARQGSGALRFEPRFPFVAGLTYTACVDLAALREALPGAVSGGSRVLRTTFSLPATAAERPRVTAVWPETDPVPANLLRLDVHFSEPMSTRGVAEVIQLLDGGGSPTEGAADAFDLRRGGPSPTAEGSADSGACERAVEAA